MTTSAGSPEGERDWGRLLSTPRRRTAWALFLTVVMIATSAWNLSPPGLREPYRDLTQPIFKESRLEQYWTYFAPDVGLVSTTAFVEIERADGSIERRDIVPRSVWLQSFRTYRWLKFAEVVNADERTWQGVLDDALRRSTSPETVVRLTLYGVETAPTNGSSGPYDADFRVTELLTISGQAA